MDEYGDWVYIILMVIVGISSLISSINKKKRSQPMQMPVPEHSDEPSYPIPPDAVSDPVPMEKSSKASSHFPEYRKNHFFNSRATIPIPNNSIQTEVSIASEKENILADELDLTDTEVFRKAIIYAEIINRKY